MSSTAVYGFGLVDESLDDASLSDLINSSVQSIEDTLPVRYVATMAELEALTGTLHPNGQVAHLTADSSSVKAGSTFIRAANKWLMNSGWVADLTTFLSLLSSNIGTMPGGVVVDETTASTRVFTTMTGTNATIQEVGSSTWIDISHVSGYENGSGTAPFSYRAVPGGVVLRGAIQKTGGTPISGAQGTQIGQLPAGAWPSYVTQQVASGVNESIGTVRIGSDGRILVWAIANRTTNFLYLDGIFMPQG